MHTLQFSVDPLILTKDKESNAEEYDGDDEIDDVDEEYWGGSSDEEESEDGKVLIDSLDLNLWRVLLIDSKVKFVFC